MANKRLATTVALAAMVSLCLAGSGEAKTRRPVKARKAAAAQSGGEASGLVQAGLDCLARKEYSAAIDHFSKAARAQGDSSSYFLLGYAYYQRGFISGDSDRADKQDAVEVVNAYSTALALDPQLSGVAQPYKFYHSQAMAYEALGNYDKALDAYRNAFLAAPRNPMLPLYAARLRFRMNDMVRSVGNFELSLAKAKEQGQLKALVSMVETDSKFSMMLANDAHLAALRKYDPSATPLAPARPAASPESFGVTGPESGVAVQEPSMRDSVKGTTPSDERVQTLRAQDKDVLDSLAAANDEFKFRRYTSAIKAYDDALAMNQDSGILNPTQTAFIWERIGTSYNKLGQSAQAIHALRQCVQKAPMNAQAHYQLALSYAVLGRFQESVHALNEAFQNAPNTGDLKRLMLLAKTDSELEPVRDLPAFKAMFDRHRERAIAVR